MGMQILFNNKIPPNHANIKWEGQLPEKTRVEIQLRSKMPYEVDFSDWCPKVTQKDGNIIFLRGPQIQTRIILTSEDPQVTPSVNKVIIEINEHWANSSNLKQKDKPSHFG